MEMHKESGWEWVYERPVNSIHPKSPPQRGLRAG
jgi:hypothetical protein